MLPGYLGAGPEGVWLGILVRAFERIVKGIMGGIWMGSCVWLKGEECKQEMCAASGDGKVFSFLFSFKYFFLLHNREPHVVAPSSHSSGRLFGTSVITNP